MSDKEGRLALKYAQMVMFLATVILPYGSFTSSYSVNQGNASVDVTIRALLWAFYSYSADSSLGGLHMLDNYSLTPGLLLGSFNIIFAFQVIRYTRGDSGKRNTLAFGVLTLIPPILFLITVVPFMLTWGIFAYIGPIPIQLITGLLLMHFAGPKEITKPW